MFYYLAEDDELFEPLQNEIKENQWLGVSVSTQKSTKEEPGMVSLIFIKHLR